MDTALKVSRSLYCGVWASLMLFYHTAFKGCAGTDFTQGVWKGGQSVLKILSGLCLRNCKL